MYEAIGLPLGWPVTLSGGASNRGRYFASLSVRSASRSGDGIDEFGEIGSRFRSSPCTSLNGTGALEGTSWRSSMAFSERPSGPEFHRK